MKTMMNRFRHRPSGFSPLNGRYYYMGRLIGQVMPYHNIPHLMRFGREMQEYPDLMLSSLNIRPGMTVADIGAGTGFNAIRMGRLVGRKGRVYATDVQREMLEHLKFNASMSGVGQVVVPVLGTQHRVNLPPNSCDLILMADTYHECTHPSSILRDIRRALKPKGRLVLVEYRLEDSLIPSIHDDHRMSINQAKLELESNGFLLSQVFEFLPWQHILIFNKA